MTNKEPTNCDKCNASFADKGYVFTYKGSELIGAICFDCDRLRMLDEYRKTKVLRTRLLTNNLLDLMDIGRAWSWHKREDRPHKQKKFYEIIERGTPEELEQVRLQLEIRASFMRIYDKMKEFEQKVWFKGLQDIIAKSKFKGVSSTYPNNPFQNFKVLTYTMCGKTIITIEDLGKNPTYEQGSVSMICLDDSKESSMGDKGIEATETKVINLIDLAIELWEADKLKFVDDNEVSYL